MIVHDQDFYDFHVVEFFRQEFLKAESFSANRSLERVLQKPPRVTKKRIKEDHPKSKEMLREFTVQHPEIHHEYKQQAKSAAFAGRYTLTNSELFDFIRSRATAQRKILLEDANPMFFQIQIGNNNTLEGGQHLKDINVGGDLNVGGDFVVADAINNSFNKITSAEVSEPIKDVMRELGDAVAAMAGGLPEKEAMTVSEEYDRLAEEAAKPEPKKNWLRAGLEGIQGIVSTATATVLGTQEVLDTIEKAKVVFGL